MTFHPHSSSGNHNHHPSQTFARRGQHYPQLSSDALDFDSHHITPHSLHSPFLQYPVPVQVQQYVPQYVPQPSYTYVHAQFGAEGQESCNEDSMKSEHVVPTIEGFPNVEDFEKVVNSFLNALSIYKKDKALITSRRARDVKMVLLHPKDVSFQSANFRFWVRKMFTLEPNKRPESEWVICHKGKPVAIREKFFKILTRAHHQCDHGGRDKTSVCVRQVYSWFPKRLISGFVKICPTCQSRRGSLNLDTPNRPSTLFPSPGYATRLDSTSSRSERAGPGGEQRSIPVLSRGGGSDTCYMHSGRCRRACPPMLNTTRGVSNGMLMAPGSHTGYSPGYGHEGFRNTITGGSSTAV
ncbi:hypothetical protein AJ80_09846 [Polytolypa hystricis UAMH7299]|uniref:Integrase zinc-binding domain-containing protein n=1 Tax=Polytolypa hystricis (strain UAMH7299) TaxID=1447883 RepID=A0A2B7WIB2_POLH7|nr:hypothetical protein AJ80_09846 [Polytolypa hystricis UAMH7299]